MLPLKNVSESTPMVAAISSKTSRSSRRNESRPSALDADADEAWAWQDSHKLEKGSEGEEGAVVGGNSSASLQSVGT